jgi:TRAP-type C4-dicarboxylate transport system permease small subunit
MTTSDRAYRLLDRLRLAQLWLAALALVVLMCVTITDVFMRYLFNSPVRGSYDLVEFMLVIFVFNGISSSFLQRRNIVIDLIDSFASPRLVAVLTRIADALALVMLALLAYAMMRPALQAYAYGDRKLELQLPIAVMWVFALAGMAGSILCALGRLLLAGAPQHGGPPQ